VFFVAFFCFTLYLLSLGQITVLLHTDWHKILLWLFFILLYTVLVFCFFIQQHQIICLIHHHHVCKNSRTVNLHEVLKYIVRVWFKLIIFWDWCVFFANLFFLFKRMVFFLFSSLFSFVRAKILQTSSAFYRKVCTGVLLLIYWFSKPFPEYRKSA
jgi:hypothetical protein